MCASRGVKKYVIAALFALAKNEKQPNRPAIEEGEFSGGVSLPGNVLSCGKKCA